MVAAMLDMSSEGFSCRTDKATDLKLSLRFYRSELMSWRNNEPAVPTGINAVKG